MKTRHLTRSSDFNSPRLLSVKNSATSLNKNSNNEKRKIFITPLIRCLADKNTKNIAKSDSISLIARFPANNGYSISGDDWMDISFQREEFVGKIEIFLISVTIKIYRCLGSVKFFDLSQKCELLCIAIYNNREMQWRKGLVTLRTQKTSLALVELQCFEHPGSHLVTLESVINSNTVTQAVLVGQYWLSLTLGTVQHRFDYSKHSLIGI